MKKENLKFLGRYNWKHQPERLLYVGSIIYPGDRRRWYQFALTEKPDEVWSEVLESDLENFEETQSITSQ